MRHHRAEAESENAKIKDSCENGNRKKWDPFAYTILLVTTRVKTTYCLCNWWTNLKQHT
jgi:hypothetical protein